MKLTTEQITQIEETLVLNGLNYDDIKLEVTDHIASEIEVLMEENTLSFDENLKLVFEKWEPQLKSSSSFLVGLIYSAPQLVMNKWVSITKKMLLVSFVVSLSVAFIFSLILHYFKNESIYESMVIGLKYVLILVSGLNFIGFIKVFRSNFNTVFSHIYKRTWFMLFIYPLFYGLGTMYRQNDSDVFFHLFFPIGISVYAILHLKLVYDHIQFEKKISLSNS